MAAESKEVMKMEKEIKVGDIAFYRGLNWLIETTITAISDGEIRLNNGVVRGIDQIGTDVFLDRESANKTMIGVYKGKLI